MMESFEKFMLCAVVPFLIITLGVLMFVVIPITMFVSSKCLQHGYPEGQIEYNLTAYCVKRVNQTDVVVPLKDLINQ